MAFINCLRSISQADLAEKAEISVIFLSNIERGVKFPKPEVMARIANALEVEVFELFKVDLVPENDKETISHDILTWAEPASILVSMNEYTTLC